MATAYIIVILLVFLCFLTLSTVKPKKDQETEKPQKEEHRSVSLNIYGYSDEILDKDKVIHYLRIKAKRAIGDDVNYSYFEKDEFMPFRVLCSHLTEDRRGINILVEIDLCKPSLYPTMDGYIGVKKDAVKNIEKKLEVICDAYNFIFAVETTDPYPFFQH